MLINLTMSEFSQLEIGETIIVNLTGNPETTTIKGYAFYSSDSDKPGWKISTEHGYIALADTYKEVLPQNAESVELIALEQFKQLKPGNLIFVYNGNIYMPAVVSCQPFKSHSLENILDNGDDWEVETSLGFIHNNSAFIEKNH